MVFYPGVNICCNLFREDIISHHTFSHPETLPSAEQLSLMCNSDTKANHSEMATATMAGKSPQLAASLETMS